VVRNFEANLDPITLLVMFGQPAFLIVILGTMFSGLIPSVGASGSYVSFLVPGMIASQMITGAVLSGRVFWLDRRWAMVEQIFSGPFLRAEYLAALLVRRSSSRSWASGSWSWSPSRSSACPGSPPSSWR